MIGEIVGSATALGVMGVSWYYIGKSVGLNNCPEPPPKDEHEHIWSPWTRIGERQERTCLNEMCNFVEIVGAQPLSKCPPHIWGKWGPGGAGTTMRNGKRETCQLQERFCKDCGLQNIQRITSRDNDGNPS